MGVHLLILPLNGCPNLQWWTNLKKPSYYMTTKSPTKQLLLHLLIQNRNLTVSSRTKYILVNRSRSLKWTTQWNVKTLYNTGEISRKISRMNSASTWATALLNQRQYRIGYRIFFTCPVRTRKPQSIEITILITQTVKILKIITSGLRIWPHQPRHFVLRLASSFFVGFLTL